MNTQIVTINGREYTVRELMMSEALTMISDGAGRIDNAELVKSCVTLNGRPVDPEEVNIGTVLKLLPVIYRINDLAQDNTEDDNEEGDSLGN